MCSVVQFTSLSKGYLPRGFESVDLLLPEEGWAVPVVRRVRRLTVATVEASVAFGLTVSIEVFRGGALRAHRSVPAPFLCMSEPLASEPPHRVRNVGSYPDASVSHSYIGWQVQSIESEDNIVRGNEAVSFLYHDTLRLRYSGRRESVGDFDVISVT